MSIQEKIIFYDMSIENIPGLTKRKKTGIVCEKGGGYERSAERHSDRKLEIGISFVRRRGLSAAAV